MCPKCDPPMMFYLVRLISSSSKVLQWLRSWSKLNYIEVKNYHTLYRKLLITISNDTSTSPTNTPSHHKLILTPKHKVLHHRSHTLTFCKRKRRLSWSISLLKLFIIFLVFIFTVTSAHAKFISNNIFIVIKTV